MKGTERKGSSPRNAEKEKIGCWIQRAPGHCSRPFLKFLPLKSYYLLRKVGKRKETWRQQGVCARQCGRYLDRDCRRNVRSEDACASCLTKGALQPDSSTSRAASRQSANLAGLIRALQYVFGHPETRGKLLQSMALRIQARGIASRQKWGRMTFGQQFMDKRVHPDQKPRAIEQH